MTKEEVLSLDSDNLNNSNWPKAINFFESRFEERYFIQLNELINHKNPKIKFNCGFLITTIDCILIETLEQFYDGENETKNSDLSFLKFFRRNEKLNHLFENKKESGIFQGIVRSGLVHQAMTKKNSIINIKNKDLTIEWIDVNSKHKGFEINRNNFHNCIVEEYKIYTDLLKVGAEKKILDNFIKKLNYIIT